MVKWTYRIVNVLSGSLSEGEMNALGSDGWELVCLRTHSNRTELVFKKKV